MKITEEQHIAILTKPEYKAEMFSDIVYVRDNFKDIAKFSCHSLKKYTILDSLKTITQNEIIVDVCWRSGVARKLKEGSKTLLHCPYLMATNYCSVIS